MVSPLSAFYKQTFYVKVITLPGAGTCWLLKHLERHLSDDTLGRCAPQTPAVLF